MILSEAIDQLAVHLGFRSEINTKGPTALARAQEQYERGPVYPWFLLSEDTTILTQINDRRIPLPAGFIAEYEEGALYYNPLDGRNEDPLEKYDYDYLKKHIGSLSTGEPLAYSQDGLYFNIWPMPTLAYQLLMKFYKHDTSVTSLSNSDTNKWLTNAPECLIGKAGRMLATGLRDNVAMAEFSRIESEARATLNIQNQDKKNSNRSYQIGGPQ